MNKRVAVGKGYGVQTYLERNFPAIKLALVADDPDDLVILQGVIGLAAAFKRQVVAKGVETVKHGSLLLQMGCDLAQGFGIARP